MLNGGTFSLLEAISSNRGIITSLRDGARHPTEIAKEFGITRIAVDKRLKRLKELGLVEPKPCVSRNSDRTIIKYELSGACLQLLDSIDNDVCNYYRQKLRDLDILLAKGELDEKDYLASKTRLEEDIRKRQIKN